MKNLVKNFSVTQLSKEQMRKITGGGTYRCDCNGTFSSRFRASSQAEADRTCSPTNTGGRECSANPA